MSSKYRMSEKECEEKLVKYLDKVISNYHPDTSRWEPRKIKEYNDSLESYNNLSYSIHKIEFGGNILKKNVVDWANFSLACDSDPEEIVLRMILDYYYLESPSATVCISYLGNNVLLDEDFVEESMYISSGFFKFEEWDDVHVDCIKQAALSANWNEVKKILAKYYPEEKISLVFGKSANPRIGIIFPVDTACIQYSPKFKQEFKDYLVYPTSFSSPFMED